MPYCVGSWLNRIEIKLTKKQVHNAQVLSIPYESQSTQDDSEKHQVSRLRRYGERSVGLRELDFLSFTRPRTFEGRTEEAGSMSSR